MMTRGWTLFFIASILIGWLGVYLSADGKIPNYSETPREQVPDQYKWRVQDLYPDMGAWEKEKAAVTALAAQVDECAKDWTAGPDKMLAFMDWLNEVQLRGYRLMVYAQLQSDANLADPLFQKMKGEMQFLFVNFAAKVSFVNPDILKLGKAKIDEYLAREPKLDVYRFSFEKVLRNADHILPAEQERLISMTGLFSEAPEKAATMLNDMDIPGAQVTLSDGTKVTLNTANYVKYRASANIEDRRTVMEAYWLNQKQFANTLAILQDGAVKEHLYRAKVRNHPDTLTAALFHNDIDPAVYRNLIKAVHENLGPLHRFLTLRRKLLGLEQMKYGDVYASAVKAVSRTYTYDEARKLVQDSMAPMGPEYTAVLGRAFDDGWIDVYPNQGKESGAYSNGIYGVHPYVKMNYDGSYSNVSTLAHELGHAMHSYHSNKAQPFVNSHYPIFLAEIASTFNETLLMQHLLKAEQDDTLKLFLLDSYLERVRQTLFRQTLFAEFELDMHEHVEKGQTLTPDWLNARYLALTRQYYGHDRGVMDVEDYIQYEWSGIPHFYYNYYVFQYSTGIVASAALADMVLREGEPGRQKYLTFLKAGGSKFPMDILKDAGLDMTTPRPVEASLRQFEGLVAEMETIAARLKLVQ